MIWMVTRRDDNGNIILVQDTLTDEYSMYLVELLTNRGHKQNYERFCYSDSDSRKTIICALNIKE